MLDNDYRVVVEMQTDATKGLTARVLYYNNKLQTNQPLKGHKYEELKSAFTIVLLMRGKEFTEDEDVERTIVFWDKTHKPHPLMHPCHHCKPCGRFLKVFSLEQAF